MKKLNKNTLIAIVVIVLLVIVGIIGYVFSINKKVATWENKIYSEINVYGVNIGGLNKEEAIALLEEMCIRDRYGIHNEVYSKLTT